MTVTGHSRDTPAVGGYLVTETMCATVRIRSGDAEVSPTIGLGKPCPGQRPPEGRSDS